MHAAIGLYFKSWGEYNLTLLPSQQDGDTLWWGRAGTQSHARSSGRAENLVHVAPPPN